MDLCEVLYGEEKSRIEPRLLLSLVHNLPEGSAFQASLAGGEEHRPWDTKTYLLANIFNAITGETLILSNAPKSVRNRIKPITGPIARSKTSSKHSPEDVASTLAFLKKFGIGGKS